MINIIDNDQNLYNAMYINTYEFMIDEIKKTSNDDLIFQKLWSLLTDSRFTGKITCHRTSQLIHIVSKNPDLFIKHSPFELEKCSNKIEKCLNLMNKITVCDLSNLYLIIVANDHNMNCIDDITTIMKVNDGRIIYTDLMVDVIYEASYEVIEHLLGYECIDWVFIAPDYISSLIHQMNAFTMVVYHGTYIYSENYKKIEIVLHTINKELLIKYNTYQRCINNQSSDILGLLITYSSNFNDMSKKIFNYAWEDIFKMYKSFVRI